VLRDSKLVAVDTRKASSKQCPRFQQSPAIVFGATGVVIRDRGRAPVLNEPCSHRATFARGGLWKADAHPDANLRLRVTYAKVAE